VVYGTYGHLNPKKDNAILLPSHYMADHHGYEWLIGPGLALDTTRYFLVATELFGNGHSSSPSNTPRPFDGPRFPVATIRDNVEAVHRLLLEDVGVTHLKAIIGFSMGAEQAFQWAVSYPDFADCIVATAGTARAWPHGIVRLEAEIGAITQDPGFHDGDYAEQPANGINQFALVWAGWLFSQEWWRKELWKEGAPASWTMDSMVVSLEKEFSAGADANNLILQARTWMAHDVGRLQGSTAILRRRSARSRSPSSTCRRRPISTSGRRRALRGGLHSPCDVDADSLPLGPPGRGRGQSGGQEVSQSEDCGVSEGEYKAVRNEDCPPHEARPDCRHHPPSTRCHRT
jgi:homoserine O-acetyltransferase